MTHIFSSRSSAIFELILTGRLSHGSGRQRRLRWSRRWVSYLCSDTGCIILSTYEKISVFEEVREKIIVFFPNYVLQQFEAEFCNPNQIKWYINLLIYVKRITELTKIIFRIWKKNLLTSVSLDLFCSLVENPFLSFQQKSWNSLLSFKIFKSKNILYTYTVPPQKIFFALFEAYIKLCWKNINSIHLHFWER